MLSASSCYRGIVLLLVLSAGAGRGTAQLRLRPLPPPDDERPEKIPPDEEKPPPEPPPPSEDSAGPGAALDLGELTFRVDDLVLPGVGIDLAWRRTYRSRAPGPLDTPQGIGWDHSYNLYFVRQGSTLLMHRGNGRIARFLPQPDGSFTLREHFEVLVENPDQSLTLHLRLGSHWEFLALDGSPAQGRISAMVDPNGNTLGFAYDGAGRLATITDTLGRTLSVAYNPGGRIASITDSTGRTVEYAYYGPGAPGGSQGDLQSVTSPKVMGTPNGNDFPAGKTTVYTYSKGQGDPRLDHNLLTIASPSGSLWLQNHYTVQTDPKQHDFDRLAHQVVAGNDEWYYHYEDASRVVAGVPYGLPRSLVISNDPRGIVRELVYDERNRLIVARILTGFAVPTAPTTRTANRPTGKLRASDPDWFQTRYAYNHDSRITRIVRPEENVETFTYEADLDPDAPRRTAGNLRERRRLPGPRGADQAELVECWTYDPASNRVASYTDAGGRTREHLYDAAGNRTRTTLPEPGTVHDFEYDARGRMTAHVLPADDGGHRRRDERTYHASGPGEGYLETSTRDADVGGLALARSFDWDPRGYLVQAVDEEGNQWNLVHNALGQLVRLVGPAVAGYGGARTTTDRFFDLDDRLVMLERESRDETGALEASSPLTTSYEYDALGRMTRVVREIDASTDQTTEFDHDASGNLCELRLDGAVTGARPDERVSFLYDERDLPFREVRAPGSAVQSTAEVDYDGNGRPATLRTGVEAGPRTTSYERDGYDRLVSTTDPMGNVRARTWGPVRPMSTSLEGELIDVGGASLNVPLEAASFEYDGLDRLTRIVRQRFDPSSGLPLGTGTAEWCFAWDALDGLLSTTDPDGGTLETSYDRAHRPATVTDARGNTREHAYDGRDLVTSVTETHLSDAGQPPAQYLWTFGHDELGRLASRAEPGEPAATFARDSRGNVRLAVDERGAVTRTTFDGLDRITSVTHEFPGAKTGSGRTMTFVQDPSQGLAEVTDDDGWTTTYGRDALGRCTSVSYPDATLSTTSWDAHDDPVASTDPNGTVAMCSFDDLGREVSRLWAPGAGVSNDTTMASFSYDGRGRLVEAADEDAVVARCFDSLGLLTSEVLTIQGGVMPVALTTTLERDARGNVTRLTYPGGRVLDQQWDALGRLAEIAEGATVLCANGWVGPRARLERMSFANGTATDYSYGASLRPVQAVAGLGMSMFLDRSVTWNDTGQATARFDAVTGTSFAFGVDLLGRRISSTETPGAGPPVAITYDLSDTGDRISVTGGPDAGSYVQSAVVRTPADAQVHQYTQTPFDTRGYDANGNLVARDPTGPTPTDLFEYDANGRLVSQVDGDSGVVTEYEYDALGRLVLQRDDALGAGVETLLAPLDGHVLEELDATGSSLASYVWSWQASGLTGNPTLAHLACLRRGGSDFALHEDPEGSVAAASDAAGLLVERYEYSDFGAPRWLDAMGQPLAGSAIGNPYLFRAARYHAETGLYDPAGTLPRPVLQEPRVGRAPTRELAPLGMPGCSLAERGGVWGTGPGQPSATSCVAGGLSDLSIALPEGLAATRAFAEGLARSILPDLGPEAFGAGAATATVGAAVGRPRESVLLRGLPAGVEGDGLAAGSPRAARSALLLLSGLR